MLASTICWCRRRRSPYYSIWLGRVHCCWLLPDLAEDLLRLPDGGVDPFACSHQVWRCLWLPCFYGWTLSRMGLLFRPPMPKMSQILPKIHWFSPNYGSLYTCSQASYQKVVKTKSDHHHCPISVYTHMTSKIEAVIEIHCYREWGGGGEGERWSACSCSYQCPNLWKACFQLENKLKMLISENERFRQEINADQRHSFVFGSFSAYFRPHQANTLVLEEKMKTTLPECFQWKQAYSRQHNLVK